MSKSGKFNPRRPEKGRNRPNRPPMHITVRSVRRNPPDLRKLGRTVIAMGLAEMEAEPLDAEAASADATPTDKQADNGTDGQEVRE